MTSPRAQPRNNGGPLVTAAGTDTAAIRIDCFG